MGRRCRFGRRILRFLALIDNSVVAPSKPNWDREEKACLMEKSAVTAFLGKIQLG